MSNSGYKGISRFDYPGTHKPGHGYQVHFYWKGQVVYRRFHDETFGGPEEALEEALVFRSQMERRLRKPRSERWLRSSGTFLNGQRWVRQGWRVRRVPRAR